MVDQFKRRRKNFVAFVAGRVSWFNPFVTWGVSAISVQDAWAPKVSDACNSKPVDGAGHKTLKLFPLPCVVSLRIEFAPGTNAGNEQTYGLPTVNSVLYSGPPKHRLLTWLFIKIFPIK